MQQQIYRRWLCLQTLQLFGPPIVTGRINLSNFVLLICSYLLWTKTYLQKTITALLVDWLVLWLHLHDQLFSQRAKGGCWHSRALCHFVCGHRCLDFTRWLFHRCHLFFECCRWETSWCDFLTKNRTKLHHPPLSQKSQPVPPLQIHIISSVPENNLSKRHE